MAISHLPSDGVQVVTTPGTSVTPATAPFDNTHTIVILNNTTGTDALVRWQTGTGAITPATGSVVPGGGALTLSIGSKSQRPTDSSSLLFFDSVALAVTVQITYVNGLVL